MQFQSTHPLRGATVRACQARRKLGNFNPRTPCGVRLDIVEAQTVNVLISIHAPLAGCDCRKSVAKRLARVFQSTHPLRGATRPARSPYDAGNISIHAPLAGCDCRIRKAAMIRNYFNPRTPCGVRLVCGVGCPTPSNFNPRTPCGVRLRVIHNLILAVLISIHAPLAGCDPSGRASRDLRRISIHAPLAGCDILRIVKKEIRNISIHAPLAGCDSAVRCVAVEKDISIHAPLAGCDGLPCSTKTTSWYFNPRTPCGVRRKRGRSLPERSEFQSTHPLRGATQVVNVLFFHVLISIHAPLAGCDRGIRRFQIGCDISIHAPLAGCDKRQLWDRLFCIIISIHAPLAGCDLGFCGRCLLRLKFQSTHPLRGATRYAFASDAHDLFQSTHPLRGATSSISIL